MKSWKFATRAGRALVPTAALAVVAALTIPSPATAEFIQVEVTVRNLAATGGTHLTPVWVAFQNGGFDLFNVGEAASGALERIAEDGTTGPLSAAFAASGTGLVDATLLGPGAGPGFDPPPVIPPGASVSRTFTLDSNDPRNRYFSYATMIVPSNDAFIANDNPTAFRIFSDTGSFLGADFSVPGSLIWDAGTELNDEVPTNTAFFGQMTENTGVSTPGGTVQLHPGFLAGGPILSDPRFAAADFRAPGFQVAQFTVRFVPEPSSAAILALGVGLLLPAYRLSKRQGIKSSGQPAA